MRAREMPPDVPKARQNHGKRAGGAVIGAACRKPRETRSDGAQGEARHRVRGAQMPTPPKGRGKGV